MWPAGRSFCCCCCCVVVVDTFLWRLWKGQRPLLDKNPHCHQSITKLSSVSDEKTREFSDSQRRRSATLEQVAQPPQKNSSLGRNKKKKRKKKKASTRVLFLQACFSFAAELCVVGGKPDTTASTAPKHHDALGQDFLLPSSQAEACQAPSALTALLTIMTHETEKLLYK